MAAAFGRGDFKVELPKILQDPDLKVTLSYQFGWAWSCRVEPEPGTPHYEAGRQCSANNTGSLEVALERCAEMVSEWPDPGTAEAASDIEGRVARLEADSHPPMPYVTCYECAALVQKDWWPKHDDWHDRYDRIGDTNV